MADPRKPSGRQIQLSWPEWTEPRGVESPWNEVSEDRVGWAEEAELRGLVDGAERKRADPRGRVNESGPKGGRADRVDPRVPFRAGPIRERPI